MPARWSSCAARFRREPDGRYAVSIGRERAYVAIEAAPCAVRAVLPAPHGQAPSLRLSDGSEERLDPASLTSAPTECSAAR